MNNIIVHDSLYELFLKDSKILWLVLKHFNGFLNEEVNKGEYVVPKIIPGTWQ